MNWKVMSVFLLVVLGCGGCGGSGGSGESGGNSGLSTSDNLLKKIELGELIFDDENLSTPTGQSCATCHDADAGFADGSVDSVNPISEGAVANTFGNRNAPTASYASLIPDFAFNVARSRYEGGLFLDGRAIDLADQAKGPFLNIKEMNNLSEADVVEKIRNASYAPLFMEVFGDSSLDDAALAYDLIAEAVAVYESTEEFQPFTSKFDLFLAGELALSESEERGFNLFKGAALCTECHKLEPTDRPLFSDFSYRNIGVPENPNLDVETDLGLGGVLNIRSEDGKFRVPTLRNVALTAPYMHNGVISTLEDIVKFYNRRIPDQCALSQFDGCWDEPEVGANVEMTTVGDLSLFPEAEAEADIVAFLKTLTDGYEL